jgi:glycosyltransferase involved in cell wall biosynthesis
MNKQVSVIIPSYNSDPFIAEALYSVLEQDYPVFEVIIIDDGSTDRTRDVVASVKDGRIRYIRSDKTEGNYFARNKGLSLAKGEYIAFLDADDIWVDGKLRKQMEAFERRPDAAACFTDHWVMVRTEKRRVYRDILNTFSGDGRDHKDFVRKLLLRNWGPLIQRIRTPWTMRCG